MLRLEHSVSAYLNKHRLVYMGSENNSLWGAKERLSLHFFHILNWQEKGLAQWDKHHGDAQLAPDWSKPIPCSVTSPW